MRFNPFKRKKRSATTPIPVPKSRRRPMKLRVTAVRREPVDIDGLMSALIDVGKQLKSKEGSNQNADQ